MADRHRRLRVATVGLGWVGTNRHLPWLRRSPLIDLVGVVDPSEAKVRSAVSRFHVARGAAARGPDQIPWLDEIDAVTIATPPESHYALAAAYLEAGKHVLLEKPMALSTIDAQRLIAIAERQQKQLAIVHNFQFARSTRRLLAMVKGGRLGTVQGVAALQLSNPSRRLPAWCEALPLGLFMDESPHLFYLVRSMLPVEPFMVHADVVPSRSGKNTPALVDALLQAGDVPVKITMNFESPVSEWHLAVFGSAGLGVVDLFRDVLVMVPNDRAHLGRHILRTSLAGIASHALGVLYSGGLLLADRLAYGNDIVIERFAQACLDGTPLNGISAADGLAVVAMQQAVVATAGRQASAA
jgi:scyllo-inositol 2-dehydrogenase (NADP+)